MSHQNQNPSPNQKHPKRDQLVAFGLGRLGPNESSQIEDHLDDCEFCNDTLIDIADDTFVGLVRSLPQSDPRSLDGVEEPDETMVVQSSATVTDNELPVELHNHSRYRIADLIGRGGMGNVYRAEHKLMNRSVALKLINAQLVKHPDAVERFRREVQAAAQLKHPNIVTAYDADHAGDAHFLVMEFVEGTDLASVVAERGRLPVEEACRCIRQAADGLQHAHDKGMVHRDIKPHNLMLDPDGEVRILDFGLATFATETFAQSDGANRERVEETVPHLTTIGSVMGSPDYLAPEQARDAHAADIRADIYSLGCTLYFLLSGRPPFETGTVVEKLKRHAECEAEPVDRVRHDVPSELATVISRMMSKDPAARFQTPSEVATAMAPFTEARKHGKNSPAAAEVRRHPSWLVGVTALLFLTVATLGAVLFVKTNKGTLAIESNDENVAIVIRQNGREIEIIDTVTGSRTLKLPSGRYEIELKGNQNGFTLDADEFVLTRGSNKIVTVRRVKRRSPDKPSLPELVAPQLPTPKSAIVNSIDMRLLPIPAGDFVMGSPESEKNRDRQETQHATTITMPFYIGMCEVTQQEYYRVMESNPSAFSSSAKQKPNVKRHDTSQFPVENVSWEDAAEFCRRLSSRKAERDAGFVYRLPTEAEWEYACRAGTLTPFTIGAELDQTRANVGRDDQAEAPLTPLNRTTFVGSYHANAFGLYDMHGNVQEWCSDWYEPDYYQDAPANDPAGPSLSTVYGGSRVIRGGSWQRSPQNARSAARFYSKPADRETHLGFRVVCEKRDGPAVAIAAIEAAGGEVNSLSDNTVVTVSFMGGRSENAATLTDDQLVFLKGLNKLETLYLVNTKVTDVGLEKYVKQLTTLRNLYLSGTKVSDVGLGHLKELADLRVLYINSAAVTDEGLENLRGMLKLSVLSLDDSQVTAAGLVHLKRMPYLWELRLNGTQISDDDLEHLEQLTSLGQLHLNDTKVTDEGLKSLKGLTKLAQLYLNDTGVGDAGLDHLTGLTKLFRLELRNTKVTDEGIKNLQKALPNCRITR